MQFILEEDRALAKRCKWERPLLPFHANDTAAELLLIHVCEVWGERTEWDYHQDIEYGFWVILLDETTKLSFSASALTFAGAACLAIKGFLDGLGVYY